MEGPLHSLDQWDDDVKSRYNPNKSEEEFRNYGDTVPPVVREFYRQNHTFQTREFVLEQKAKWLKKDRVKMGILEAMHQLNQLVDDSDPDTDLSQIDHNLQTAEAIRRDGYPRWMILTGFIHDLGKILWYWGEPQWAVVGDTFPVGCAYSDKIVFRPFFENNPDSKNPAYQTELGVYSRNCGLDNVDVSWGHDEYLYHVVKDYLPEEAHYIIRYHSCYPIHKEGAYGHLLNAKDREMLEWVKKFNPYDLYSKGHEKPNAEKLWPYYTELVDEFFPKQLAW